MTEAAAQYLRAELANLKTRFLQLRYLLRRLRSSRCRQGSRGFSKNVTVRHHTLPLGWCAALTICSTSAANRSSASAISD